MSLSRVEKLRRAGFDRSYAIPFERSWQVRCSQCKTLVINGMACHETGCPNQPREEGEDD